MPSIGSRLIPLVIRLTGRGEPLSDPDAANRHIAERALRPEQFGPPRRLRRDVDVSVVHDHGFPVYTVAPTAGPARHRAVYVHGGGWVNEIDDAHWRFVAALAAESNTAVRVPIYPLLPWGTAGEVVPWVASLVGADIEAAGSPSTFLLGDSAGGQIVLSAAIWLRDNHFDQPGRTFLIAPIVDSSLTNPAIDAVEPTDPWLSRAGVRVYVERWRGALAVDDPLVSPLAAALGGLAPVTVFSGTRDILNPDSRVFVDKVERPASTSTMCRARA